MARAMLPSRLRPAKEEPAPPPANLYPRVLRVGHFPWPEDLSKNRREERGSGSDALARPTWRGAPRRGQQEDCPDGFQHVARRRAPRHVGRASASLPLARSSCSCSATCSRHEKYPTRTAPTLPAASCRAFSVFSAVSRSPVAATRWLALLAVVLFAGIPAHAAPVIRAVAAGLAGFRRRDIG